MAEPGIAPTRSDGVSRQRRITLLVSVLAAVSIVLVLFVGKFYRFNQRFLAIRMGSDFEEERQKLLREYPTSVVKGKDGSNGILVIEVGDWLVKKTICIDSSSMVNGRIDCRASATDILYFIEYQQFENDERGMISYFKWR